MIHSILYDPIRKKDVPDTPEERVRQRTIKFLQDELNIPEHYIIVEFPLSSIDSNTKDRVDILVQNFKESGNLKTPWLLVECKAKGEYTWESLQIQLNKYLQILNPQYILLSLGELMLFFEINIESKKFKKIEQLPKFQ